MFIFGRGLDTINKSLLIKSIIDYNNSSHIPENINIVRNINLIPQNIRDSLPQVLENGKLYRDIITSPDGYDTGIFFLLPYSIDGKEYLSYQIVPDNESDIFIKPEVTQTIYILGISSLIILIAILILIRYLINKVLLPINVLEGWVNTLSINNINDRLPNLQYPELYRIADFIKSKFISEYEFVKSEESFWKFCSHELRTPISVIRLGIEVMQKYVSIGQLDQAKFNNILKRLMKSSFSMSNIIETILWLNKGNSELSLQKIDLAKIVNEIIDDFKRIYILDNCNINIYTHKFIINQPELAVRIVIENLIRNAFQHSIGEEICISQVKNHIKIINKLMPSELDPGNTGFGLGHELVRRLAKKLNWEVKIMSNNRYNFVSVKF